MAKGGVIDVIVEKNNQATIHPDPIMDPATTSCEIRRFRHKKQGNQLD